MKKRVLLIVMVITLVFGMNASVWAASPVMKTLYFYSAKGKLLEMSTVSKNSSVALPSCPNQNKYTFVGWSLNRGDSSPGYCAGDIYKVRNSTKFYAVLFDKRQEQDFGYSRLGSLSKRYSAVIFVGDSRTNGMKLTLESEFGRDMFPNVKFIARNGSRLNWLKSGAYRELNREIKRIRETDKRPIAVVFNHGVNDIKHEAGESVNAVRLAGKYGDYMNSIGEKLKRKNCKLFYMSVNPINSAEMKYKGLRSERELFAFNNTLKELLKKNYTYIDTCSWLYRNGYSTSKKDAGRDDGIHFTSRTYKRIFQFCMKKINGSPR